MQTIGYCLRNIVDIEFLEQKALAGFEGVEGDTFVIGYLLHRVALHQPCEDGLFRSVYLRQFALYPFVRLKVVLMNRATALLPHYYITWSH